MSNPVVDEAYYDWLLNIVGVDDDDPDANNLVSELFSTIYYWSVANDDNRAADGIVLRSTFMDMEGWNTEPLPDYPCTVLEMLIGLARRIDSDIMWDGVSDNTERWFWEMIDNLEINNWSDRVEVRRKIDYFLDRKYDVNGVGGLFPLRKGASFDQREVEIWYQAQSYLMENYEF